MAAEPLPRVCMRIPRSAVAGSSTRQMLLLLGVMVFATASVVFAAPAPSGGRSLIDKPAPAITRTDLNGRPLDLRAYRGKVVLLNFWATWCAPCLVEMPVFARWQQQYGPQRFQVVSISMDDDSAPVRKTLAKLKVNYPVAMGDAALGERYGGVLGLPLTYLIDRDGIVRARFQGETDVKKIEKQVRLMLGLR